MMARYLIDMPKVFDCAFCPCSSSSQDGLTCQVSGKGVGRGSVPADCPLKPVGRCLKCEFFEPSMLISVKGECSTLHNVCTRLVRFERYGDFVRACLLPRDGYEIVAPNGYCSRFMPKEG